MRMLKVLLCLGAALAVAQPSFAAPIDISFDQFGSLPAATFGGSGIPNDAVAITTIQDGANFITLGLTATPRFGSPAVTNDGLGTFTAQAGAYPGSSTLALWNFDFFAASDGGSYLYNLVYDFDPAANTGLDATGVVQFQSAVQDSWNLGFAFLHDGATGVTPPTGGITFDPLAAGEYTFALQAIDPTTKTTLGQSAIKVDTIASAAPVPEPGTIWLFALGAIGMIVAGRRGKFAFVRR